MKRKHLALLILVLFIVAGCAGKAAISGSQSTQPSPEAVAFKAITVAFDAYDIGMTSLRLLQRNKIITTTQYEAIKKKIGWPLYNAIVAAQNVAQAYAAAPAASKESLYGKLTQALEAIAASQKDFTQIIQSLQSEVK